jgi:hypothetical protein
MIRRFRSDSGDSMAFQIKDLVVDVVGLSEGPIVCQNSLFGCHAATCKAQSLCLAGTQACTVSIGCVLGTFDFCTPSDGCRPSFIIDDPRIPLRNLATLREQLNVAMREIEIYERELAAAAGPRTQEQADALEKGLEGALEELRAQRKSAGKKTTDTKKK